MIYRVNEIYAGLEGEGHMAGTPCVRVRLQGCSVATCKLRKVCDQSDALAENNGTPLAINDVLREVLTFDALCASPILWTAISGGEPTDQHIEPLLWVLADAGKQVRVETSGMVRRLEGPIPYLRVSPKEPVPRNVKQDWGMELSVVYTGAEDLSAWERFGNFAMRTLQPLWRLDGSNNVTECIEVCLSRPAWQLSVQTHKLLGLR